MKLRTVIAIVGICVIVVSFDSFHANAVQPQNTKTDPLHPKSPEEVIKGYLSCSECHGCQVGDGKNSKHKKYKSHEFAWPN